MEVQKNMLAQAGDACNPVQSEARAGDSFLARREGRWRAELAVNLPDRPGALADLASLASTLGANIERLVYDRGEHPHRVDLAVSLPQAQRAGKLLDRLAARGYLDAPADREAEPALITDLDGVLCFKVALRNRPGTLAELAERFRALEANVIHLRYDSGQEPEMAEASVSLRGAGRVSELLGEMTRAGYHYHVLWRGGDDADVDAALGFSEVEAFLFKLRSVLPPERMSGLEELFNTSREMRQALAEFRRASGASGEALAASETFADILRLAAMAVGATGPNFTLRLTGPVPLTPLVSLYMLACPEGANSYLLRHPGGLAFLDTNFGIFFEDVMAWMAAHGFDPARVDAVLATHPDADHAGWAGRLQERYGARVFMHPECERVFALEDRTLGRSALAAINRSFTRLVGRLTGLTPPARIEPFEAAGEGAPAEAGGLRVMGRVRLADLELLALESLGGHVAGQVFYYGPEQGVLFTGDYLLDPASLSPREREALSVHKSLLTNTNADSALFHREMAMLRALMRETMAQQARKGRRAMVFPGHGDFYGVDQAGW
ncbi:hypothetical protein NNJEOMEG_00361 [Fundidesulfovibrio magnetotacticus]|uniref:Metallo-beta-lactamase domain-containing protein n=1 Tax=Fundidesulfovibrio magnetotacticus TaxID=2730080 RepID=A0A6V8LRW9_9BACT|nr:MBL fold metallo-hydrolase [Fundidesulfovibrio magnetotacticus]GFK92536.1 hypothetical protein NNJEOMEG_00361 [Fundidesulfovibrio magnetotacticus]